jgi:hypothetical protein
MFDKCVLLEICVSKWLTSLKRGFFGQISHLRGILFVDAILKGGCAEQICKWIWGETRNATANGGVKRRWCWWKLKASTVKKPQQSCDGVGLAV